MTKLSEMVKNGKTTKSCYRSMSWTVQFSVSVSMCFNNAYLWLNTEERYIYQIKYPSVPYQSLYGDEVLTQ